MGLLSVANSLVDILSPPHCPLCDEVSLEQTSGLVCFKCVEALSHQLIKGSVCSLCGMPFTSSGDENHTCGLCIKRPPAFIKARSLFAFELEVREAVHTLKYKWGTMLGPYLGGLMAGSAVSLDIQADFILPVPLHSKRIRSRGFNQSVVIARHMAKSLSTKVDVSSLVRTRATPSQVGLTRGERRKNVAGAFTLRDSEAFNGRDVLLVDDVLTTGATVGECAAVLKKAGARVTVMTLARVVH